MISEINAVNLQENLGAMLSQVQDRKGSVLISKDGQTVAALIDAGLFQRIQGMRERFDALSQRIARDHADVPADQGMAQIDALVAAERERN